MYMSVAIYVMTYINIYNTGVFYMDEDTVTKDPADVRLTINVHEATLEDKYNTSKELLPAVLQVCVLIYVWSIYICVCWIIQVYTYVLQVCLYMYM